MLTEMAQAIRNEEIFAISLFKVLKVATSPVTVSISYHNITIPSLLNHTGTSLLGECVERLLRLRA